MPRYTQAIVSKDTGAAQAKLVLPAPVHKVWFAHVPVAVHKGSFAVLTIVLNCAIAAEGQSALLLFMQVARVLTASQT